MLPNTPIAASLVGRKLGLSSRFLSKSLHRLIVSKSRNVSPTLDRCWMEIGYNENN